MGAAGFSSCFRLAFTVVLTIIAVRHSFTVKLLIPPSLFGLLAFSGSWLVVYLRRVPLVYTKLTISVRT